MNRTLGMVVSIIASLATMRTTAAQEVRQVTLREVLNEALAQHPRIHAADARIRAAQGARSTAGRFENPMFAYQVENAPLPGRGAPPMDREAMTMATLPLQSLYQRWPRVRRAEAEVAASEAEAAAHRQEVALAAARAFYRTALAQVGVETAADLVLWLDSIVAYNRVRVHEGVAAEADLIRSELERDRAKADRALEAAELVLARAQLRVFLADNALAMVAIDSMVLPARSTTGEADAALIARRPDVRAARQHVEAAQAAVGSERSMLIPDLHAMLGLKQSAGTTSLIAGASLPFPVLNQNRGEIKRALAERDAAAFESAAVEQEARAQIAAAREVSRLLTEQALALSSGFLARADEARSITLAAYREGAVPLIQVMDASRAWGEARRAFYQTLFRQHESVLALIVAEGFQVTDLYQPQNRQ